MSATIDTWTAGLGLLVGFCAIFAWLAMSGTPSDAPTPSASIRLGTLATGELAVSPIARPVLEGRDMRPGRGRTGSVTVRNQTPRPVRVSVRTTEIQKELDAALWIEVRDGARIVMQTPLAHAQEWSRRAVALASGESKRLRVRAWIPRGAQDGWQAARGDLTLEFRTRAGGR